jgi:hypothetical protein
LKEFHIQEVSRFQGFSKDDLVVNKIGFKG